MVIPSSPRDRFDPAMEKRAPAPTALSDWTTTSNLVAVRRLLLEPDDPEVCGPAPQRYRLKRKRATMSMPWLLLSATAVGRGCRV